MKMSDLVFVEVWHPEQDRWYRVNPEPLDRYTASIVLMEAMKRFGTARGQLVLHADGAKDGVEM